MVFVVSKLILTEWNGFYLVSKLIFTGCHGFCMTFVSKLILTGCHGFCFVSKLILTGWNGFALTLNTNSLALGFRSDFFAILKFKYNTSSV